MGRHEASVTLDQREPWGSLQVRFEVSSFLPELEQHRLEVEGEVSLRLARGLAFTFEGTASRLRDLISLPRRGATAEEVLLRLRRLQSGYEYDLLVGLTFTFGSILQHRRESAIRELTSHAGTAPGRPSSITNEARVRIGESRRVTYSTTLKSARSAPPVSSHDTWPR
jgi:hypothetical protein